MPGHLDLLVERVRLGDESSFAELYQLTSARIGHVVLRTVRSREHAAEVVQEVYLHVWRRADSFDPSRSTALGWLTMLAHRRAVDRVRQVVRSVERDHRATLGDDLLVADVALAVVSGTEASELRAAVDRLPTPQREAVLLTYFGGCTHQQAAAALGVPLGTLKTRVHTATATLRRHYAAASTPLPAAA